MLHSHKDGILYLEHCKVSSSDDRLTFSRYEDAVEKFWSIPYAATGCILLGPGTSLTHKAAKFLSSEGVMIGFVGGGGSPLYFASQNEYRPTEYMQDWCSFWFEPKRRIEVAKFLLLKRAEFVQNTCSKLLPSNPDVAAAIAQLQNSISKALTTEQLLGYEAVFAKSMYRVWATHAGTTFKRTPKSKDTANMFLDHGNYLAYGIAAAALWVMGISHAFAVLHGQTRRGALVFDIADVVKDGCVLPSAFLGIMEDDSESNNRVRCIAAMDRFNALPIIFDTIKGAIDVGCGRV